MKNLIFEIQKLKSSKIGKLIDSRMKEFEKVGLSKFNEIFGELCFCILTANFSAQGGIRIQKEIGGGFLNLNKKDLAKKLASLGHRFPTIRAEYIFEARKKKEDLMEKLNFLKNENLMRVWLVKNIKGIGMKEASHFLRNIGYKNLAIIDFHILDLLIKKNLIEKPKSLTQKKYLEIELVLKKITEKVNLSLGELDLYLWYKETGKILK